MTGTTAIAQQAKKTLVWDLPVRLFHWLLVILIGFSWYSVEITGDLDNHMLSGYAILTLILFRLAWGFFGTRHARFRDFIYPLRVIADYSKTVFRRQPGSYAGHNPLGGLSVLALIAALAIQTGTGLFANDEYSYFGPLSDYVSADTAYTLTTIHHFNFNILMGLIVLHIAAVLFYQFYKRDHLTSAMFTGRKPDPDGVFTPVENPALIRAGILFLLSAAAVYCLVEFT